MLEFGIAYNHTLTLGLATREGARTGASLGDGNPSTCAQIALDPSLDPTTRSWPASSASSFRPDRTWS